MRSILIFGAAAMALAAALPAAAQTAPDAATGAPPAASSASQASTAASTTAPAGAVSVGTQVKDKTGAVIGQVTEVQNDASGKQTATVKMGADTFALDSNSFALKDGAAVVNATKAEVEAMVKQASNKGG